ncbi:MAG: hypothetical protein IJ228_09995 [Succinivibrio sp.]|nr:hypothetical protein [Succinivibrio sp.]
MQHFEELTVNSVPALWSQRERIFAEAGADLTQTAIDSAGIAFLVRWAKSRPEGRLKVRGLSTRGAQLIRTFKIAALIEQESLA